MTPKSTLCGHDVDVLQGCSGPEKKNFHTAEWQGKSNQCGTTNINNYGITKAPHLTCIKIKNVQTYEQRQGHWTKTVSYRKKLYWATHFSISTALFTTMAIFSNFCAWFFYPWTNSANTLLEKSALSLVLTSLHCKWNFDLDFNQEPKLTIVSQQQSDVVLHKSPIFLQVQNPSMHCTQCTLRWHYDCSYHGVVLNYHAVVMKYTTPELPRRVVMEYHTAW